MTPASILFLFSSWEPHSLILTFEVRKYVFIDLAVGQLDQNTGHQMEFFAYISAGFYAFLEVLQFICKQLRFEILIKTVLKWSPENNGSLSSLFQDSQNPFTRLLSQNFKWQLPFPPPPLACFASSTLTIAPITDRQVPLLKGKIENKIVNTIHKLWQTDF